MDVPSHESDGNWEVVDLFTKRESPAQQFDLFLPMMAVMDKVDPTDPHSRPGYN